MSLQPRRLPEVPADTARAARVAFPRGSLAVRIRDERGEVWSDQRLRGLFGVRGKPGISPAQLMIVLVLAMAENLTDRQAADMVRRAIDGKYARGLPLEDPGFDFTVLSEFRTRLVAGSRETEALDVLLVALAGVGTGEVGRAAAHRLHPRAGTAAQPQPASAGRAQRPGGAGDAGRRGCGLADHRDQRLVGGGIRKPDR